MIEGGNPNVWVEVMQAIRLEAKKRRAQEEVERGAGIEDFAEARVPSLRDALMVFPVVILATPKFLAGLVVRPFRDFYYRHIWAPTSDEIHR